MMKLVWWSYPTKAGLSFFRGEVVHSVRRAIGVQWRWGFLGLLVTEPPAPTMRAELFSDEKPPD